MSSTKFVRNMILRGLRYDRIFSRMATMEINGFNFAAADIALPDSDNCYKKVYRLVIIKHWENT